MEKLHSVLNASSLIHNHFKIKAREYVPNKNHFELNMNKMFSVETDEQIK